jgi:hypothetical protein
VGDFVGDEDIDRAGDDVERRGAERAFFANNVAALEAAQHGGAFSPAELGSGDFLQPRQILEQLLGAQGFTLLEFLGTGLH